MYSLHVARGFHVPWLGLLSLFAGCSYYDASLLEPRDPGIDDAGADTDAAEAASDVSQDVTAGPDADATAHDVVSESQDAPSCGHIRPPEPPTNGGGGDIEIVAAVSQVDFGDVSGTPNQFGYDLDFRCTCQGEGSGCIREAWATADACDGPEGRDNNAGSFIAQMAALLTDFGSAVWTETALLGEWGLLLRIRGYNGLPDDDMVRLDWYVPNDYSVDKPDNTYVPAWDGSDTWPIRTSTLTDNGGTYDLDSPRFYDEHAYVSGGVLVGSLAESVFQLSSSFAIQLDGAFITAELVDTPQGWKLQGGLLSARWKLSDILAQVGRVRAYGSNICMDHIAYDGIKKEICSFADMYSGIGTPTSPCDALSTAMVFETTPAAFGAIVADEVKPNPCDPSVDPASDSCNDL